MSHFTAVDWAAITAHEGTELDAPATESELAEFEHAVGVTLPASHKELLRRGNGGTLGRVRLFGVIRSDALDLRRQIEKNRGEFEQTPGPVLPFARDWGGSYFCFDLRAPGPDYPVLYWNQEQTEEPDYPPPIASPFAEDFVAFVRRVVVTEQDTPPPAPRAATECIDAVEYAGPGVVRPPSAEIPTAGCWPWLGVAQVPAAAGIVWVIALWTGRAEPGYMGMGYLVAWFTSVGGTLLSLIITLCFARTRCGHVGCLVAIAHAFYLIILLGLGALVILVPRESNPGHGGGF